MTVHPLQLSLVLATLSTVSPGAVVAQFPPDSVVNLQVLPNDMSVREVIGVMRGFALGLGVRCPYCHVGDEGQPLSTFDFPSDEKATKRKARVMLEMVNEINGGYLTRLPDRTAPNVTVECVTCHRGQARPVMIEDIVRRTLATDGVDAAVRRYRALRERYYGSHTYDFSELTLTILGQELLREGNADRSIAVLELNREFYPNSAMLHVGLGEAHRAKGDTSAAVVFYERALELDPTFGLARQRLRQLRGN